MKKRIISLILVLAMSVIALASCGYSFAKSDLSSYATFTDADKADLLKKLESIIIKDGDFTTDPAKRENKVMDTIYSAFANAAKDDEKKTTGVPGARDLIYYCYYVTGDFKVSEDSEETVTAILFASTMKQSSAVSFQLGASDISEDAVKSAIAAAIGSFDFTDKAYTSIVSGKTVEGQIAYVTYTTSYTPEGQTTPKNTVYTNQPIVIGKPVKGEEEPADFASFLSGQSIATKLDKKPVFTEGDLEVTYSNITINWVSKGDEVINFNDVTYTETKKVTDTTGTSRDLKNVNLTYHIYPVSYQSVAEFSAQNLFDVILGKDVTAEVIYGVLFGREYTGLDEKKDADKIAERVELLKDYKTADGEDLEMVITKIATLYKEMDEAETSLEKAKEALTKAKDAEETAKKKVEDAGEEATEAEKNALTKATENREKAEAAEADAQKLADEKKQAKEDKLAELFAISVDNKSFPARVEAGYKTITYTYLEEQYNEEIRMNLAKEVYFFLTEAIEVTGTPEKAVEETYDQLIQNYKHTFYNETNSETKKTYYSENNGSFKKFLVSKVTKDIKTVKTYKEALAAVKEKAAEYVEPIVRIYVASKAYDVLATDKEYKAYKNDPENNYSYNEYSYGKNSVLYAYQFDKLMNFFLEFEEEKAETADENGYFANTYKYAKIGYEFGEPESEKEPESTENE